MKRFCSSTLLQRSLVLIGFFILAILIIHSNYQAIDLFRFELGDYAANSILIQDAKSFVLLKGNYSRVGLNHPGPVILYVLAFGEVIFYDWLHLVPSPFSGQLAAVAFYSAAWITLIGIMFYRFFNSVAVALLLLSIFILSTAYIEPAFFNGIWFPYLYFFPFAVFTLAIARITTGKTDSLLILAISTGFLVNGHVSFMATCAMMLIVALIGNKFITDKNSEYYIFSNAFFIQHKTELLLSTGVLLFFFVPLLIETVFSFPDPLAQYVGFGKSHKTHSFSSSFKFIAQYWGNGTIMLLGFALLMVVCATSKKGHYSSEIRGIAVAIIAATAGIAFYVRFGIDDLSHTYVAFFYYCAAIFTLSTLSLYAYEKITWKHKQHPTLVFAFIFATLGYTKIAPMLTVFNNSEIPTYSAKIQHLENKLVVLDLGEGEDWGLIWTTMTGIAAYEKRHGIQSFCIHQNWHILFTEKLKCTDEQLKNNSRYFVSKAECPIYDPHCLSLAFQLISKR